MKHFCSVVYILLLSAITLTAKAAEPADTTSYFQGGRCFAVISKSRMTLTVYNGVGVVERVYPMACGRNDGDKAEAGDMRTPVGLFRVTEILDSHLWKHDFGDGNGQIKGAYGPRFVRLVTGHNGIGIHGTHDPSSIGKHATEGCIRLLNSDALEFATEYAYRGMPVIVTPSTADVREDLETLVPASEDACFLKGK